MNGGMNVIEFLGFLVTMLLLIFLSMRQRRAMEKQRREFDAEEQYDEDSTEKIMRALNVSYGEAEEIEGELRRTNSKQPPPPPKQAMHAAAKARKVPKTHREVGNGYQFKSDFYNYKPSSKVEQRHLEPSIEHRYDKLYQQEVIIEAVAAKIYENPYDIIRKQQPSRGKKILQQSGSLKNMIVTREILGPPKALS